MPINHQKNHRGCTSSGCNRPNGCTQHLTPPPMTRQSPNTCGCAEGQNNCQKLMEQIRAVDFALYEVVLYLDVYPHCMEALDTYHKLIARQKALYEQYETTCGPITSNGNISTTSWDWTAKPFPWENAANESHERSY